MLLQKLNYLRFWLASYPGVDTLAYPPSPGGPDGGQARLDPGEQAGGAGGRHLQQQLPHPVEPIPTALTVQ